jgi:hypothetical protein
MEILYEPNLQPSPIVILSFSSPTPTQVLCDTVPNHQYHKKFQNIPRGSMTENQGNLVKSPWNFKVQAFSTESHNSILKDDNEKERSEVASVH